MWRTKTNVKDCVKLLTTVSTGHGTRDTVTSTGCPRNPDIFSWGIKPTLIELSNHPKAFLYRLLWAILLLGTVKSYFLQFRVERALQRLP